MTATSPRPSLRDLKMVCYFPQPVSWQFQWSSWPGTVDYAGDMRKIKSLGANAVNLRIDVTSFGYPTPSATAMARFDLVFGCAVDAGLNVVITTFDNFTSYTDIAGSEAWLSAVVGRYANHPRVTFLHLRNEINRLGDSNSWAWLKALIPYARTVMGSVPVSASVADTGGYAGFNAVPGQLAPVVPDFWDWHWYPSSVDGLLYPMLANVIATNHPGWLHIGETGASTYPTYGAQLNGIPQTAAAVTAYQDWWLRIMATACQELGLNFQVWMLYDVNPAGAPNQGLDYAYAFGLYDASGNIKPAGTTLRSIWTGNPIDQSWNQGFETGVDDGAGGTIPALWRSVNTGANTGTVQWDNTTSHTGAACVKFAATTGTPQLWTSPTSCHVTPGQTVTATAWAKGASSTGTNVVSMDFYSLAGTFVGEIGSNALANGSPGWTQLTATGTVPASAAYARIYLKSGSNSGTVWFDDVTFTRT